jgi:multiple antibiotic resistance protein
MLEFKYYIHIYLMLFAMVNAVGNLPVFAGYTMEMDKKTRKQTFFLAVLVGGSIVLGFALAGDIMLRSVFEIPTSAFKVAGGLLVFAVAAKGVLQGSVQKDLSVSEKKNIAVFPLGFPFLAGPGTILTTILFIQDYGRITTAVVTVLVYLTIVPVLFLAPYMEKIIGRIGVMVVSRILYIFIGAKAISFILEGLKGTF